MNRITLSARPTCSNALFAALAITLAVPALAGPLSPPVGPVASTYKTLTEVEPRTIINATNTPGGVDSLFRITRAGSYYLTGNVTGVNGKHGILIASNGVTIDLNGFELDGDAGTTAGFDGVRVDVAGRSNITIRNGTVRGWSGAGVNFAPFSPVNIVVTDVQALNNGGDGIAVGASSRVSGCTSSSNTGDGIQTAFNCVVTECIVSSNGQDGLNGNVTNLVSRCAAYLNGVDGISAGINSTVTDCVSYDNADEGFVIGSGGSITGCTAHANTGNGIELFFGAVAINCASQVNQAHGIAAVDRCTIVGNTCVRNGNAGTGSGIFVDGNTGRIEGNACVENDRGIQILGFRNFVVRNTCMGNTTANWDIAANNVCGPILNRSVPDSAAILGNSAPSSLGTTDANANFTH
jgi:hypothetical protein